MLSSGVTKQILDNGLTVLIKENHASPTVAIVTYVKAGYFNESDRLAGISHLIEHMFFKGTRHRGVREIGNETKALGGYLNASTIYDHTVYYTVLPSHNFSRGLDIQSDALIHSVFDPEELRKETEVVIQEAKRKLDTPTAVATEKLFDLAFERHRIRRWRIGTEEGLRALSRDDFLTFHKNLYRPPNIILAVVGDIETASALREIASYYGEFERGKMLKEESPPEPSPHRFKYREIRGDIQQAYLAMGFHAPSLLHPDSYALEMLAFISGHGRSSRLFQNVKETQKLVNSIFASNYALPGVGMFMIEASGKPQTLRPAVHAIMEQVGKLRESVVAPEELIRARNLLESLYVFSQETVSGLANILASYEALGDYRLAEEFLQKLYEVTEADIARVANQYLTVDNCSLLEYVPEQSPVAPADDELAAEFKKYFADGGVPRPTRGAEAGSCFNVFSHTTGTSGVGKMKLYELANGMKVMIKEIHQLPLVSLGVFAKGGRRLENPKTAGMTGLTLRTSLKGTTRRSAAEIARAIENLGTAIQFSNNPDYCNYSMTILSKNLEAGFDILADVIARPAFPDDEIAKEKDNTLAFILREKDDMFQRPLNLFYAALFNEHPYGLSPNGDPEQLVDFKREDLIAWQRSLFEPQNQVLALVGDVDAESVLDLIQRKSVVENSSQSLSSQSLGLMPLQGIAARTESREKAQSALALGFPGPKYCDDDYYALTVLQGIVSGLGGRFFEELRGRQSLAYTVSAFLVSRLEAGAFVSYIATSPEKEETARFGLLHEFEKLLREPVTEEELERAIRYTIGSYQIGLETYCSQMFQFAHDFLLGKGLEEVESYPQKISRVTRENILQAAQKYFTIDRFALGLVRGRVANMSAIAD